ncbi:hypothetical protein [Exiguobacterium sp. CH10]|uniref:hypothetical protein n=1 Tax=Exiguobacterium sp. CH10 TaxID=2751261 RepID=UPI001BE6DA91|nr:hypothetical protein [Exiguobacterium sp. CH10]
MNNYLESKNLDFVTLKCFQLAAQGVATFSKGITRIDPEKIVGTFLEPDNILSPDELTRLVKSEIKTRNYLEHSLFDFVLLESEDGYYHLDGEKDHKGLVYKCLKEIGELDYVQALVIKPVTPLTVVDELDSGRLKNTPLVMTEEVMMAAGECANTRWREVILKREHKM